MAQVLSLWSDKTVPMSCGASSCSRELEGAACRSFPGQLGAVAPDRHCHLLKKGTTFLSHGTVLLKGNTKTILWKPTARTGCEVHRDSDRLVQLDGTRAEKKNLPAERGDNHHLPQAPGRGTSVMAGSCVSRVEEKQFESRKVQEI